MKLFKTPYFIQTTDDEYVFLLSPYMIQTTVGYTVISVLSIPDDNKDDEKTEDK